MSALAGLKIPVHIAAIMDGNGRWARRRGLPRSFGHRQGMRALREVVRTCGEIGVKFLTVFTLSTENWQRPENEIKSLMKLLVRGIDEEHDDLMKNNVRVRAIGRLRDLPEAVQRKVNSLITDTRNNTGLTLTLALSYGGRAEIIDALKKAFNLWQSGRINRPPRTEDEFSRLLYDPELPPVDLLIRTGGEKRISNFLLWQSAYAELYFTETLWPDFRRNQLLEAIADFSRRQRRFGRIDEK
ncbi:MAG: isoprenyl transferase [candidate division WOR-3 bacterium]|jgi:undecaprenyl diphosphate synthase